MSVAVSCWTNQFTINEIRQCWALMALGNSGFESRGWSMGFFKFLGTSFLSIWVLSDKLNTLVEFLQPCHQQLCNTVLWWSLNAYQLIPGLILRRDEPNYSLNVTSLNSHSLFLPIYSRLSFAEATTFMKVADSAGLSSGGSTVSNSSPSSFYDDSSQ